MEKHTEKVTQLVQKIDTKAEEHAVLQQKFREVAQKFKEMQMSFIHCKTENQDLYRRLKESHAIF